LGLTRETIEQLRGFTIPLRDLLKEMELKTSEKSANRLLAALASWQPQHPKELLRPLIGQLTTCIKDEADPPWRTKCRPGKSDTSIQNPLDRRCQPALPLPDMTSKKR
jgi:hypothetical protein